MAQHTITVLPQCGGGTNRQHAISILYYEFVQEYKVTKWDIADDIHWGEYLLDHAARLEETIRAMEFKK